MQTAKSITKNVRVPPRKARLAADLIRGLSVEDATLQLLGSRLKAGKLLYHTLINAAANAGAKFKLERSDLMVQEVRVDAGPVLKRAKSKSKGGRVPVMKRTSHFMIVVAAK